MRAVISEQFMQQQERVQDEKAEEQKEAEVQQHGVVQQRPQVFLVPEASQQTNPLKRLQRQPLVPLLMQQQQERQQAEEKKQPEDRDRTQRQRKCPYCLIEEEPSNVNVAAVLIRESEREDGEATAAQTTATEIQTPHEVYLQVVDCFWKCFNADQANLAVAAVHSLGFVVAKSKAQSALELFIHLRTASDVLDTYVRRDDVLLYIHQISGVRRLTTLPLQSACLLYQQAGWKQHEQRPSMTIAQLRAFLVEQARRFATRIARSKQLISDRGIARKDLFVKDHMVVLTHGRSSCVEKLLLDAWTVHHKRFSVVVTRYDVTSCSSFTDDVDVMVTRLAAAHIPAVATSMNMLGEFIASVDFVIVGTEAVAGDGGVLNGIGTATTALAARQHKVPFYVACEACKFRRSQMLQPPLDTNGCCGPSMWSKVPPDYRKHLDYTRPELISLLFTDVGVFAPRYVTFEMAKLFGIPQQAFCSALF